MRVDQKNLIISLLYISFVTSSQASTLFKFFDVPSAIVNYEINGSGKIADDNYLEISGQSTLLFDEWGIRKIYKEKYTETTTGAVKNIRTVRTLDSEDHGVESHVNFENEKINKNNNLIVIDAINKGEDLYAKTIKDMQAQGTSIDTDTVLGYKCNVWLYKNKKRCIYKGISLKEEFTASGINITKIAVSMDIDINISDDVFTLPDFTEKRQKGFLMKEGKDTHFQNIQKIKDVVQDEISSTVEVRSDDIELKSGLKLTDDIFKIQKEFLPKLLVEMQESRVCLENAEDIDEANSCIEKLIEIKEKVNGEADKNSTIISWTQVSKDKILSDLESRIMDMKRRMPCITRSKNFDDISSCLKVLNK